MPAEDRLRELGIDLPEPPKAQGSYVTTAVSGNLAYLCGHGPWRFDGSLVTGKVGAELTLAEGHDAARLTCLGMLATLRAHLGSLDRVTRVVKVFGLVNATPDFEEHPAVINGCSDLLVEVFGEAGKHARTAMGAVSLPRNIAVEIEAIVEFE